MQLRSGMLSVLMLDMLDLYPRAQIGAKVARFELWTVDTARAPQYPLRCVQVPFKTRCMKLLA